jgi:hypothetical protein
MNPILKTIIFLLVYIVLTILCVYLIEDTGEKSLAIVMDSFYLAPLACLLFFCTCLFFDKTWFKEHKMSTFIFAFVLIGWLLWVLYYINSLIHFIK